MVNTYLTTDELSSRIKYDARTIRERLKDSVLLEGTHYVRPFGGRKILYVWETIERDMRLAASVDRLSIPMAVGADPNLSHRADRILSQGWEPTLRVSAVDKFSC
ncbi:hypothetical protein RA210_U300015 [Rubrivivax sp. A210]|nr:hypothetical protein RA210_U300015 [Rubrivivax sp. A210]